MTQEPNSQQITHAKCVVAARVSLRLSMELDIEVVPITGVIERKI